MNLSFLTQTLAKSNEYLPTCHSTNDIMLERLNAGAELEDGHLVFTFDQTKGRGQRGNVWEVAAHKNLTFTLLLKPNCTTIEQYHLNVLVTVSIMQALQELTQKLVKIKWPNDLYVYNEGWKKIGGILIENRIAGDIIKSAVVGIGINVNQDIFDMVHATSLKLLEAKEFDLIHTMNLILIKLEHNYLGKENMKPVLKHIYTQNLLFYGEKHKFEAGIESFEAEVLGVNELGALVLKVGSEIRKYEVKEVRFVF